MKRYMRKIIFGACMAIAFCGAGVVFARTDCPSTTIMKNGKPVVITHICLPPQLGMPNARGPVVTGIPLDSQYYRDLAQQAATKKYWDDQIKKMNAAMAKAMAQINRPRAYAPQRPMDPISAPTADGGYSGVSSVVYPGMCKGRFAYDICKNGIPAESAFDSYDACMGGTNTRSRDMKAFSECYVGWLERGLKCEDAVNKC